MTHSPDPTRPLSERSPDEVADYIDDHIMMALNAADMLHPTDRDAAEEEVQHRLIAISFTYNREELAAEEKLRRMIRLRALLNQGADAPAEQ